MGIDINLLRKEKGGNPDLVRESQRKRNKDPKTVDIVIELDEQWRKKKHGLDGLKKDYNDLKKKIGELKKANKEDPCTAQLEEKAQIEQTIEEEEKNEQALLLQVEKKLAEIGNLVNPNVPDKPVEEEWIEQESDEVDAKGKKKIIKQKIYHNRIERTWGEKSPIVVDGKTSGKLHHHQILYRIDGFDSKRGRKVAGHRGYFLINYGVILCKALERYGIDFLMKRGYVPIQTPFFMKKQPMSETCQLSDFEDQLYKVLGDSPAPVGAKPEEEKKKDSTFSNKKQEDDEKEFFLIATSEQPISAYFRGEWLEDKSLPQKFAGTSTCFRKEAGAHGKQVWGIFRIHQFEKVEQFVLCKAEDSVKIHEDMINVSEEFMKSLGLAYRVINIVSGALNDAAAMKYDLEAWFPGYNEYMELNSCSNCTDFQSRSLEVRQGTKKGADDKEKRYVHMLNGTLVAVQRTLCCLLENYQTETGLKVPDVLKPYVGIDFIPYVKDLPKDEDLE